MAVADLISQDFFKSTQVSSTCPRDKHHEDGKALRLKLYACADQAYAPELAKKSAGKGLGAS